MKLLPPPGPQRRRQFVRLGAFVALLIVSLWYNATPRPAAPAPPTTAASARPGVTVPAILPSPIALEKLEAVSGAPTADRNPFGFGVKPAPPPPPAPKPLPPPPAPPPGPPPPPPGPPPITLKLVGIMTHPTTGLQIATLKDASGNAVFQATEGAVVDGKYKIIKINVQSVVIAYLDGTGQRTIGLGG